MTTRIHAAALALALAATTAAAQTPATYTFESGTVGTGLGFAVAGYQFENFGVLTTATLGAGTNATSGTRFALGRTSDRATSSYLYRNDGNFWFLGAAFSFRSFDGNTAPAVLTLRGYRTADPTEAPAFVRTLTLTNTAQRVDYGFSLGFINELEFDTETLAAGGRQAQLALDDVTLATVPEPASIVLLATGLGAVALVGARRRAKR